MNQKIESLKQLGIWSSTSIVKAIIDPVYCFTLKDEKFKYYVMLDNANNIIDTWWVIDGISVNDALGMVDEYSKEELIMNIDLF